MFFFLLLGCHDITDDGHQALDANKVPFPAHMILLQDAMNLLLN